MFVKLLGDQEFLTDKGIYLSRQANIAGRRWLEQHALRIRAFQVAEVTL